MKKEIDVFFDKLYRYPRCEEHAAIAIPMKKGELFDLDSVSICDNGRAIPMQAKVTSRHEDGSIRYMFARFMVDLPANKGKTIQCVIGADKKNDYCGMNITEHNNGYEVSADGLKFRVVNDSENIFEWLDDGNALYRKEQFVGPILIDDDNNEYNMHIGTWKIVETGNICTILKAKGYNEYNDENGTQQLECEFKITAYAKKPWVEISYRLINSTDDEFHIGSMIFYLKADMTKNLDPELKSFHFGKDADSTGCGDEPTDNTHETGPLFHTRGILELNMIEERTPVNTVRTCVGSSNYKTDFYIARDGEAVNKVIDGASLCKEANEHFAEVLYGTFFTDRTDEYAGVCGTIFQAQQNYPKAVKADAAGIYIMLVPKTVDKVVMQRGMSREQKFLLHFHASKESILEIDNRSLIYQMPDRPCISPEVFRESQVMRDVFPETISNDVEIALIEKCDNHSRCYGMLNWGDSVDPGYTLQGRGNGDYVWSNNEYDYPHACALMYARTGIRRFLDYVFVTCSHWMDVDVCHYSANPNEIGGQWEHTAGHCKNGIMVCSHEWVEGLLDYYHFSGDERGYETAIGIGENVLRLLDTPMYAHAGEANARETGWALRTLTALYIETRDKKWLSKCEWIIDSFRVWEDQYGNWLAPYTDNTVIRVGFMISVAVGSVMRYYREFPDESIKGMLLRAIDDIIENCYLDCGLFYYKELPSIARLGNNTLLLEALAIGYELTGDTKYLEPGMKTFYNSVYGPVDKGIKKKEHKGDVVVNAGASTKTFAQCFIPTITYYKAISDNNMWKEQ